MISWTLAAGQPDMPPYFLLDNSDVEIAVIDVDSPTNFGLAIMCGPTEYRS
jgi:hypothetical protein